MLDHVSPGPFFASTTGPVRTLCPLAPNNVNTMACAALAAHNLGFDKVQAVLTADPSLTAHVVEIECLGPVDAEDDAKPFSIKTVRYNPAKVREEQEV
jgi:predicted dinucleotide-utilizing enzyme